MESLGLCSIRGRDRERERENTRTIFQKILNLYATLYTCVCSMNMFYTTPRWTDRSTIVLQCSLRSSTLTPKIYSRFSAPNRPSFTPVCVSVLSRTDRSQQIRFSASSADPADVELVSQQSCTLVYLTLCTYLTPYGE